MDPADTALLHRLRLASLDSLERVIGRERDVALLDVPNQRNVGDALIWAGEIEYLAALGLRVRYAADLRTFSERDLRRRMPDGVVLLHGGGNFGDIWAGHQQAREQVVATLPDYRIVQLPQSLYFQEGVAAARANEVLAAHPDFHALLRDSSSLSRAADQLPDVQVSFCHDMALGWQPPASSRSARDAWSGSTPPRVVVIAREDKESSSGLAGLADDWVTPARLVRTDWHNDGLRLARWQAHRTVAEQVRRVMRSERPMVRDVPTPTGLLRHSLRRINRLNIAGGVATYDDADVVVVDRLHAHVLAALLGIDHVVLDNSYGKVRSIYDDYTGEFTTARFADDLDHAHELVSGLLGVTAARGA